jgi:hypothetical protein
MKYPRIRSKTVITAAIAFGMFLSLTTARSEPAAGHFGYTAHIPLFLLLHPRDGIQANNGS